MIIDDEKFTIEDFENFLRENPRRNYRQKCDWRCPIARYLQLRLADFTIRIMIDSYGFKAINYNDSVILDGWMDAFIREFDEIPHWYSFDSSSGEEELLPVSAKEVIAWFENWKRRQQ